jgi:hypothetical protein
MFGRKRRRPDKPPVPRRLDEVRALDRIAPPGPKVRPKANGGAPEDRA